MWLYIYTTLKHCSLVWSSPLAHNITKLAHNITSKGRDHTAPLVWFLSGVTSLVVSSSVVECRRMTLVSFLSTAWRNMIRSCKYGKTPGSKQGGCNLCENKEVYQHNSIFSCLCVECPKFDCRGRNLLPSRRILDA